MTSGGFTPPESGRAKEALKHFGAAFAFLLLGLCALIANSSALAQGNTSQTNVIAGLHLLTLGWLSLSIFGALQVFMGVALGVNSTGGSLPTWTRRIWVTGVILFCLGLEFHRIFLIAPGLLLLGVGLTLFTIQLLPALIQAKRGQITRAFTAIALLSLWSAWSLGTLAGLARGGVVPFGLPPGYFAAHVLVAAFGWVGAMVIGVGSHLVPMFALSKPTSDLPIRIALPIWAGVPVTGVISAFYPALNHYGWILAGIGSFLWMIQFSLYITHRIRKEQDFALLLAAFATGFLGLGWLVLIVLNAPQTFIAIALIGWLTLFTLGIYHRVLPFLVWFLRFTGSAVRGKPPRVKDLVSHRLMGVTAISSVLGMVTWTFGLILHQAPLTYTGSSLLLLGALACLGQIKPLRTVTVSQPQAANIPKSWLAAKSGKEASNVAHTRISDVDSQPGH